MNLFGVIEMINFSLNIAMPEGLRSKICGNHIIELAEGIGLVT